MSYEKFVTTYHKYTHAPRSVAEAYKTPEYCNAITSYPKVMSRGMRESLDVLAWFLLTGLFVGAWTGLYAWLFT